MVHIRWWQEAVRQLANAKVLPKLLATVLDTARAGRAGSRSTRSGLTLSASLGPGETAKKDR